MTSEIHSTSTGGKATLKSVDKEITNRIGLDSLAVDRSIGQASWYCETEEEARRANMANLQKRIDGGSRQGGDESDEAPAMEGTGLYSRLG